MTADVGRSWMPRWDSRVSRPKERSVFSRAAWCVDSRRRLGAEVPTAQEKRPVCSTVAGGVVRRLGRSRSPESVLSAVDAETNGERTAETTATARRSAAVASRLRQEPVRESAGQRDGPADVDSRRRWPARFTGGSDPNRTSAGRCKIADAMAPCVLFVDEIEKALERRLRQSGRLGCLGAAVRLAAHLAQRSHQSDVFFVGTCNDISKLPPEFTPCRTLRRRVLSRSARRGNADDDLEPLSHVSTDSIPSNLVPTISSGRVPRSKPAAG